MMSIRALTVALAVGFTAMAEALNNAAENMVDDSTPPATTGKAPAARAAVAAGTATGKGGKGKGGKAKAPEIEFDTLKDKLMQVVENVSKEAAVATLDRFGLKKLSDASTEQYQELDEYLDQVIAGDVNPLEAEGGGSDDLL